MNTESIDRTRTLIDAAWLKSDADGITRHLAEDAVLMPPHTPRQVGRQAINSWLRSLFEHYTMTDLAMPQRDLAVSGDLAVERSLYEWTLTPKDGGDVVRDQANWVGIWKRDEDGAWREICGIWNSTLPLPQSAQPVEQSASLA